MSDACKTLAERRDHYGEAHRAKVQRGSCICRWSRRVAPPENAVVTPTWERNPRCTYHATAERFPRDHSIPWNCPTYWDGCNCEPVTWVLIINGEAVESWRFDRDDRGVVDPYGYCVVPARALCATGDPTAVLKPYDDDGRPHYAYDPVAVEDVTD